MGGIDMPKIKVKCLHGVEYSLLAIGTQGEVYRLKQMLSDCCCYVCHNRHCETPIEGNKNAGMNASYTAKGFAKRKRNSYGNNNN